MIMFTFGTLRTKFNIKQYYTVIDKQKALRRDHIYNIENTDIKIGALGVYLHLV